MPSASDPSAVRDLGPSHPESGAVALRLAPPAPRLGLLIPSAGDLIFLLLLVSLAAGPLAQKMLGDAGIGWHIRAGELILRTRSVPRVDPFSLTMNGKPWFAWEWLYDLVVGGLDRAAGLNGVVLFSALVIALTFALVFRKMLARGSGFGVAVTMLLLAVSASSIHFLARPHVVSWLFTVIFFGVLAAFEDDGNPRRLLWIPVIMLVWVNLHGGFLVGLVLVGIWFLAESAKSLGWVGSGERIASARKAKLLAVVGALSAAATLANPYGYHLHEHIYRYLGDRFLMDHIDEFLSPNFHGLAQKCFAAILLFTIAAAATAPSRLRASELMVVVFAVYSGLYATRDIPVSSMLLVLVMAPSLSGSLGEWARSSTFGRKQRVRIKRLQDFSGRIGAMESSLQGHWWPILVVLLGIYAGLQHGRLGSAQVMDAHFDSKRFPVRAVDWSADHGVGEAMFCPDSWGGYLIYRRYPEMLVVVDDRHDFYGAEYLKNYLKAIRLEPGWEQALEGMHANWILVPEASPLAARLAGMPTWKAVYRDQTAVLFMPVKA